MYEIILVMVFIKIFFAGIVMLVGAILLNWLASILSLPTWYDLLQSKSKLGNYAIIWLFLLYPLSLGGLAYLCYLAIFTRF